MNNETKAILKIRLVEIPKAIDKLSIILIKTKDELKATQEKVDSLAKEIESLKNEREKIKEDIAKTEAK